MRPNVYLVKKPDHMSNEVLYRFVVRENIAPVFDLFPDVALQGEDAVVDVDLLLQDDQILSLPNDSVDEVERQLDKIMEITAKDWLIVPFADGSVYAGKIDRYEHIRYRGDRYVKHFFALSDRKGFIDTDTIPDTFSLEMSKARHLEELSAELYNFVQRSIPQPEVVAAPQPVATQDVEQYDESTDEPEDEALETREPEQSTPMQQPLPPKDNHIVTPHSFSAAARDLDTLLDYKKLHESKELLYDYLLSHIVNLRKVPQQDCDLAVVGIWHDSETQVEAKAYQLQDTRGHTAWQVEVHQHTVQYRQ